MEETERAAYTASAGLHRRSSWGWQFPLCCALLSSSVLAASFSSASVLTVESASLLCSFSLTGVLVFSTFSFPSRSLELFFVEVERSLSLLSLMWSRSFSLFFSFLFRPLGDGDLEDFLFMVFDVLGDLEELLLLLLRLSLKDKQNHFLKPATEIKGNPNCKV